MTINDKLQRDVAVFADIPETLCKKQELLMQTFSRERLLLESRLKNT